MSKLAGSSWSKKKILCMSLIGTMSFVDFSRFLIFHENSFLFIDCSFFTSLWPATLTLVHSYLLGEPSKRRFKRREVEQIQKDVRRMHSLNFEHVQKILRTKRLQRQAKTGNNVIKRRPGRPRKQPLEESEPTNKREEAHVEGLSLDMLASKRSDGRTLGMPVLERCDDLSGLQTLRPNLARESLDLSNHDSISATIEKVVHQARSVTPLAKGGKRRGRGHSMDELWAPSSQ